MIIIRLMGGLGNQMFQYAFGRRMANESNSELVLDDSLLRDKSMPDNLVTHRDFALDIFNLGKYRWATDKEVFLFNGNPKAKFIDRILRRIKNRISPKILVVQNKNELNEAYLSIRGEVCFVGRWQSEIYFKDVSELIRSEFVISSELSEKIIQYGELIRNSNSVCIHVRRGDLITSPIYNTTIGVLDLNYYKRAIQYLNLKLDNPSFCVFSDDIEWCKLNFKFVEPCIYFDNSTSGKKGEGHLYLMQKCRYFIISNSTYAWWGAWLADYNNKIVLYPKDWYKDNSMVNLRMCPENWVSM